MRTLTIGALAVTALLGAGCAGDPAPQSPPVVGAQSSSEPVTATGSSIPVSAPVQIVVIGDSYTSGAGAVPWPNMVWQNLGDDGVVVDAEVAGEGGSGYVTPGHRGTTFGERVTTTVSDADDLVVFFGSRNDRHADPDVLADRARDTFEAVNRRAPRAALLVIAPVWPTTPAPPEILGVRDTLREQATTVGAAFVDPVAAGWLVDRPDLIQEDGIHPNDTGQEVLAELITAAVRAELSTSPAGQLHNGE